jgi:uncharacterized protein (DUF433 family)
VASGVTASGGPAASASSTPWKTACASAASLALSHVEGLKRGGQLPPMFPALFGSRIRRCDRGGDGRIAHWPRCLLRTIPLAYPECMPYERITIDPGRMRGLPCIRHTRLTVSAVLGQLAAGRTTEQVLADYPYLEQADILAALEFAADAVQEHELPLARPA